MDHEPLGELNMKVYLAKPTDENGIDSIVIHDYDIWNMDYSLAKIILPMLEKLKQAESGYPSILNSWEEWEEIINTMIYSFSKSLDLYEFPPESNIREELSRIQVGFDNFGKYYMSLWT